MSAPLFGFQYDIVPRGILTIEAANDASALKALRSQLAALHGNAAIKIVSMSVRSNVGHEQRHPDGRVAFRTMESVYDFVYHFATPEVPE